MQNPVPQQQRHPSTAFQIIIWTRWTPSPPPTLLCTPRSSPWSPSQWQDATENGCRAGSYTDVWVTCGLACRAVQVCLREIYTVHFLASTLPGCRRLLCFFEIRYVFLVIFHVFFFIRFRREICTFFVPSSICMFLYEICMYMFRGSLSLHHFNDVKYVIFWNTSFLFHFNIKKWSYPFTIRIEFYRTPGFESMYINRWEFIKISSFLVLIGTDEQSWHDNGNQNKKRTGDVTNMYVSMYHCQIMIDFTCSGIGSGFPVTGSVTIS